MKCGGVQVCRPLGKTATKETEEMIVGTIKRIEAEIDLLEDTLVLTKDDKKIQVKHHVLLTMLDGKCR